MKKTGIISALGLWLLLACNKNNDPVPSPAGTYAGTFTRVGMVLTGPSSVRISFTGNAFTGESDKSQDPAICNGSFQLSGDSVNFQNACAFPADFDWSLILSGKYRIAWKGDSLFISRMYVGFITYSDSYRLKKQ